MLLSYYGRQLDDGDLSGRLGRVARVLNRAHAFLQRQAEVFAALSLAQEQHADMSYILRRVIDEGLTQPTTILTRGPVDPPEQPYDTGIQDRPYERRPYHEGTSRTVPRVDRLGNMVARYSTKAGRRYGTPVTVREVFHPVSKESV